MWRRCSGAVSLLAVVVVALSGCASTPTTAAAAVPPSAAVLASPSSPSSSPSPTPSASPTASATPFVSSADEAGAHAFVVAYFAELNRAYATGDVSRLATFRTATCICIKSEKLITSTYAAGGRIAGAHFTVLGWAWGAHGPAFARTAVAVEVPAVRRGVPGRPLVTEAAAHGYWAIDLRRQLGRWTISDIRVKRVA